MEALVDVDLIRLGSLHHGNLMLTSRWFMGTVDVDNDVKMRTVRRRIMFDDDDGDYEEQEEERDHN